MADKKLSGLKPPTSRIGRPSGILKPGSVASAASSRTHSPEGHKAVDDFIIGDRVYVGGNKPGVIAFLGETKFAPGEWAGVVLDELVGKNDGSVQGVRYFQCEDKRGVFSKPAKLTRHKINDGGAGDMPPPPPPETPKSKGIKPPASRAAAPSPAPITSTPRAKRDSLAPKTNLKKNGITASNTSLSSAARATVGAKHIKIGDRVIVNGAKSGVLRFIGTTDFAAGEWAGVELDAPEGKNDGTVAGKRYFECAPNYGLFALVHKVAKESVASVLPGRATPSLEQQTRSAVRLSTGGAGLVKTKANLSQESLNSVGSAASSASRSRVRLGVTSLQGQKNQVAASRVAQARKAYTTATSAGGPNATAALQKALKEKEEHIEQLLREREMERSEVFRTSSAKEEEDPERLFEAEENLAKMQADYEALAIESEARVRELFTKLEEMERSKKAAEDALSEQEAKLEDLQFQMEEQEISRMDDQTSVSESSELVEKARTELIDAQTKLTDMEARFSSIQSELDAAKTKFANQTAELDDNKAQLANLATELADNRSELANQVTELADTKAQLENQAAELSEAQGQLKTTQGELTQALSQIQNSQVRGSQSETEVAELQTRLTSADQRLTEEQEKSSQLTAEINTLKKDLSTKVQKLKDGEVAVSGYVSEIESLKRCVEEAKAETRMQAEQHAALASGQSAELSAKLVSKDAEIRSQKERCGELEKAMADLTRRVEEKEEVVVSQNIEMESKLAELKRLETSMKALTDELNSTNQERSTLSSQTDELKLKLSDTLRQLEASETSKVTLHDDKVKLEKQIEDLMKNSGDSSQQLTLLNDELREKDRKLESVQAEHNEANQKCQRLQEVLDMTVAQGKAELERINEENNRSHTDLQQRITELESGKNALESRIADLNNKHREVETSWADRMTSSITEWESKLEERDNELTGLHSTKSELEMKASQLMQRVESLQKEKESTVSELNAKIEELKSSLVKAQESSEEAINKLAAELSESKSSQNSLSGDITRLEQQSADLTLQLDAAKSEEEKWQVKVQSLVDEVKSLTAEKESLTSERDELIATGELLTAEKLALVEARNMLVVEKESLNAEKESAAASWAQEMAKLNETSELSEKQLAELQQQVAELQSECESAKQEKELSIAQANTLTEQLKAVEANLAEILSTHKAEVERLMTESETQMFQLSEELATAKSAAEVAESALQTMQHEKEEVEVRVGVLAAELNQSQEAASQTRHEADKYKEESSTLQYSLDEMRVQVSSLEGEKAAIQKDLTTAQQEVQALNKSVKKAQKEIEKLNKRLQDRAEQSKTTYAAELDSKQEEIEVQSGLISAYEAEIAKLKKQVNLSSGDQETISNLRAELRQLESEREALQAEVDDISFRNDELIAASAATQVNSQPKTTEEAQTDFLNAVIVDQQDKIKELERQVQVLTEAAENGYLEEQEPDDTMSPVGNRSRPPRLFCDICDIFDAHDTDDCPIQGGGGDSPPPSHHGGSRGEERPYCDNCEVFDHWTEDCDVEDEY